MILTTKMKKCAFSIDKEETAGYNNTIENIITLIWKYEQENRILKVYRQEKMNKDLPGIILLSHGPFAVSLVKTAQMIFGDSENIAAFSLEAGDDIDKYRGAFTEMIEAFPEGSLIMVDLFGGTPCNQVMRYIQETGKTLEVAAGMNLPMLINAVMSREELIGKEFSMDTVENGKKGIFRIDVEGFLNDDDE